MKIEWTYGESNPDPLHAMEVFYRYTIGPVIIATRPCHFTLFLEKIKI